MSARSCTGNPLILGSVSDQAIPAGTSTVLTQAVTGNVAVFCYLRTMATVILQLAVNWTDANGAQSSPLFMGSLQAGDSILAPTVYVNESTGSVTVTATADIANAAVVSISLKGM